MKKKILYGILGVFLVVFIGLYVVLFTSFGNKIIASYIEDTLKTSTGLDANLSKFELRFSSLDVVLDIGQIAEFKVEGNLSLFRLGFDLDYLLSLKKDAVKQMSLNLKNDLNFGGRVFGTAGDFNATGAGALFGSNVALNARILDYSPLELKLDANGIKIEELLAFVAKPAYATGVLNLNANVQAKDLKPYGNALINLYTSSINYAQIKKDFNLTLPQKSNPIAQISADINDKDISAKTEIANAYLDFTLLNTKYNLENSKLSSDFELKIPNVSALEPLLGVKTSGGLNAAGNAQLTGGVLDNFNAKVNGTKLSLLELAFGNLVSNINAKQEDTSILYKADLSSNIVQVSKLEGSYDLSSSTLVADLLASIDDLSKLKKLAGTDIQGKVSLSANASFTGSNINSLKANADIAGGKLVASSDGKSLDINVQNLDLAKALVLAAQPSYVNGILNAKAHLSSLDFSKLNGSYEAKASGSFNARVLSQILGKKFPANAKYDFSLNGDIKNSLAAFSAALKSDLANLSSFKGTFDLNKAVLSSNFTLDAYDFSKFNFLAERKLKGKALFTGDLGFTQAGLSTLIQSSNLFGGALKATLKNNVLNANLNGVDFSTLMQSIDLPDYYSAKANVDVNYNLLSSSGVANASLNGGKLKKTGLINTIATLTKSDFTNDVFNTANAKAQIGKNSTILDVNMVSPRVKINIAKGVVNTISSTLNLPLALSVDKATFKATITGKMDNPSVNIDAGSVVKAGVNKLLNDKKLQEKGAKELNKLLDKLF